MKNTSVALGDHFEEFVAGQVASGRYTSASEVMRDALRLLEAKSNHREAVIAALIEGEQSGDRGERAVEIVCSFFGRLLLSC